MTDQDLLSLHKKMLVEIEQFGGKIDRIYYCPHLASLNCECRKPKSGMILKAIADFPNINREFSYLIGDSESDMEAGKKEGLQTVKVNILNIFDKMINSSTDQNNQSLGAFYILGALTLVSNQAAESMPWLYESVFHN